MRCGLPVLILGGLLSAVCWGQTPADSQQPSSNDQQQSTSGQTSAAQNQQSGDQGATDPKSSDSTDDKPSAMQRLKKHLHDQMSSGCVNGIGQHCWDKPADDNAKDGGQGQDQPSGNAPLPRSDQPAGESSSRNTKIDLSPPPGEVPALGVGDIGEVQEMKPWNPHKADKDNEVGDYYFKQKNYRAAESRYSEALYWQDNNARALFGVAQAQEKLGKFADARKNYQAYLKLLPDGEFSARARQGLDRMKDKPDQPVQSSVQPLPAIR